MVFLNFLLVDSRRFGQFQAAVIKFTKKINRITVKRGNKKTQNLTKL